GLLSKVYLTMAGAELAGTSLATAKQQYDDSARVAAQHVMQSGWVTLEPSYMRLFDGQQQINSNEILFQIGATHQENTGPEIATFFNPHDYSTAGGGGGGFLSMRQVFYSTFDTLDRRIAPGYAIFAGWKESSSSADAGTPAWYQGAVPTASRLRSRPTAKSGGPGPSCVRPSGRTPTSTAPRARSCRSHHASTR